MVSSIGFVNMYIHFILIYTYLPFLTKTINPSFVFNNIRIHMYKT